MTAEIRTIILSLLFTVAEQQDYLENITQHADAIGWHLKGIDIDSFKCYLTDFFDRVMKLVRRLNIYKITVAFDETYVPYFGDKWSLWIHAYKNKVKGATGSYKFMVCSIVLGEKRFVLYMMPMYRGQETSSLMELMLRHIKKYFHVRLVLCDRGFFSERVVSTLEEYDAKYVILTPKNKKIQAYLKAKELEVIDFLKGTKNKSTHWTEVRYVFAYNIFGHDWAFTTNVRMNILALIMTYKGRWGIETTFRVMDHAEIKSKSTNIVIRTFFFMIAVLLYDLWLEFKEDKPIAFKEFLDNLALANTSLQDLIQRWKNARALFDSDLSAEEERILSLCAAEEHRYTAAVGFAAIHCLQNSYALA